MSRDRTQARQHGRTGEAGGGNKTVFLCCPNCVDKFNAATNDYLAKLAPPPGKGVLTVPERAVIDTGTKKLVYVEREPGQFDGIEVELGPLANGFYPVVKGLRAGDRVASAGAFLVDAETRLNPGAGAAFMGNVGMPGVANSSSAAGPRAAKPSRKPADKSQRRSRPTPSRPNRHRRRQSDGPCAGQTLG